MLNNENAADFRLSIGTIATMVAINGDKKSYVIEGPMGSGKSSMVDMLRKRYGDKYHYAIVDCTQWDVGDVQIPDVDKIRRVVEFLPNVLLVGDNTKPIIVLLDELGKASRPVQNALLPVLLERRVGAVHMYPGSKVFAATNLGAEGVGDLFQPHARNRVSFLEMRYPTNEEWINEWAIPNNVHPAMLAWADENPQLFHSFKDHPDPNTNHYIFHPKAQRRSFVSPRSLYLASIELDEDRRAAIDDAGATLAGIAGNIGAKAALDLMAYVHLSDKMPSWKTIVAEPEKAHVCGDSPAAMCLTVFSCVAKVEQETLGSVMTYIQRLPKEIQCMFATQLLKVDSKTYFAASHKKFSDWVAQNHWILRK